MSEPLPVISIVTLGVSDLTRSIAFYEAIGFQRKVRQAEGVGFFKAGACAFAVWSVGELAKDADVEVGRGSQSFRGVALAWNCHSEQAVEATVARAKAAGATISKRPEKTFYGGYAGYFADPDGHLWEVAYNPGFPLSADGRVTLPD